MNELRLTATKEQLDQLKVVGAFQTIIKNKDSKALVWCVNYAKAGLNLYDHELYVQVLYVLSNMTKWRGPEAKEVRETLKQYVKEYKTKGE